MPKVKISLKTFYKPMIVLAALACLLLASAVAARAEAPSVSATYLYELSGTDVDMRLDQPRDVFADLHTGEIFVADSSNNRIRVYNESGMQVYEFGSAKTMRRPQEVAVNSQGRIYVMHTSAEGLVVSYFSFRGLFEGRISFADLPLDVPIVMPSTMTIDRQDNLYIVDDQVTVKRILVFKADGQFLRHYRIMADLDEKKTKETFPGKPFVDWDGTLYAPNPSLGMIYVYSPQGEFIRHIGRKGGGAPGTLNFPVDVAVDSVGRVLVLDKTLSAVIAYDKHGTYLGQFGGRGVSPGWFVWPNSLAVDSEDRVYVLQVPLNRLQALQLNRSIPNRVSLKKPQTEGGDTKVSNRGP